MHTTPRAAALLLLSLTHPSLAAPALRGLEALEHLGTPEARAVVEGLARGDAAAELTREARDALLRMKR